MTYTDAPVVVLGGGIAAATACIRLAQSGLEPVWISPQSKQTFKPGEHLSSAALPLLKEIGSDALLLSAMHREAYSTYSAWGSDFLIERNSIVQLEGPPNVLDRVAFEEALSQQAVQCGVKRIWSNVSDLSVENRKWQLTTGERTINAGFIFDATGRRAIVASKFSTRFQADKLACVYGIWKQSKLAEPARPVTIIEADENGWWYLALLANQSVVVNYFSDPDLFPQNMVKSSDTFDQQARKMQFVGAYLKDYEYRLSDEPRLITTNTTWVAPVIGSGWAAIGDAAASFDPLSSHGMTTALWTAIQAVDAFLCRDMDKMQAYSSKVAEGVHNFLSAWQNIYAQETRFGSNPFWLRRISAPSCIGPQSG